MKFIFNVLVFIYASFFCGLGGADKVPYIHPVDNVTVTLGETAILTCTVEDIDPYKLIWIRNDIILSLETHLLTRDPRIEVSRDSLTWRLEIRQVQLNDSGSFICELNTDPPISRRVFLNVLEDNLASHESLTEVTDIYDDADSDEIDVQYSDKCGGLISVSFTATDLAYRNPDEGAPKTCIWVIRGTNGPVGLTLIKPEVTYFTGHPGNEVGQLSLQTQFLHLTSTVPRLIEDEGVEIVSDTAVTIVVFTSRGGQNFHLRLRSLGQNGSAQILEKIKVHVDSLGRPDRNLIDFHKFSYPSLPGQKYSGQEHRLVVLQSSPGSKIHVHIDYVDMEQNVDHLNVFKFSKNDNKFLFLQRFTGNLGQVTDASFEGDKGQPILLYFKTFGDTQGTGFKFSYSYKAPKNESTIPAEVRSISGSACGGLIILPKENELVFNSTKNTSDVCVWGLWTPNGRHIGLTFNNLPNLGESEGPVLSLQRKFRGDSSTVGRVIRNEDEGKEIVQTEAFVLLVFTSKSNNGFRLSLRELIRPKKGRYTLNYHLIGPQPGWTDGTFAYPLTPWSPAVHLPFTGYDYQFIVFKAVPGRKLYLSVDYLWTTPPNERLILFSFSKTDNKFILLEKFSGNLGHLDDVIFEGNENQPVLVYFRTDPTVRANGFNISYNYEISQEKRLNIITTKQLQRDLCPLLNPTVQVNHWPIGNVFAGRLVYSGHFQGDHSVEDCVRTCCEKTSCNYALLTGSVCYMLVCDTSTPELCDPVELTVDESKTAHVNLVVVRPPFVLSY